jgi:two-component system OmpR family response regulator
LAALERVMHVEDDPSIRMVTQVTLEKVGKLKVLSCEGGEAALARVKDYDP